MKLEELDLNLLLAFDTLAAELSVTRAAARLGVSQPALSGSLARLRRLFGDPLFERAGGQMRPTSRARQLAAPIRDALAGLRAALEPGHSFQSATAVREFRIAATDQIEAMFAGPLIEAVRAEAPGVSLRFQRQVWAFVHPLDALRAGQVDLGIGLTNQPPRAHAELRIAAAGTERFLGMLRKGVPCPRGRLTLRALGARAQIRVVYHGTARSGLLDDLLSTRGIERDVALTVTDMTCVPAIVADSDLLGVAPERFARRMARLHGLRLIELPRELGTVSLEVVWHERRDAEPALKWLRELAARVLRRAGTASGPAARRAHRERTGPHVQRG